jgi:hypothetical protein
MRTRSSAVIVSRLKKNAVCRSIGVTSNLAI